MENIPDGILSLSEELGFNPYLLWLEAVQSPKFGEYGVA